MFTSNIGYILGYILGYINMDIYIYYMELNIYLHYQIVFYIY